MATSEENDLIGYDPLAWMEGDTDKNEETINSDNELEEPQLNEVVETNDYSDDSIGHIEEITISNVTEEVELTDEMAVEDDNVLAEEIANDSVSEQTDDGAVCDLDATLTIQHVVKLHEKLKNCLAINDQIEINASDVSSIDTATLQLLVSLKKDAVKLQKKVSIIYPSPRFIESAKLLGLLDVLDVHDL